MQAENEYQRVRILHQGLAKKLRMIHIEPETVSSENLRSTAFIYAPISGSVTRVFVNSGTHVSPDEPIMEIETSDPGMQLGESRAIYDYLMGRLVNGVR